ncbi:MAG TPA: PKD domain-containing protein, partial [Thermodesulfovibrionales bacterium]|nr:PKD domain-containing protein [Thermodesulfovibrionales bacterium]
IQSPENSGLLVLEQFPSPGTIVMEKSRVNLTVSEQMERPVARILPSPVRIPQGRKAVFRSLSGPKGKIREVWKGPGGQQAGGPVFEVDTRHLTPSRYEVTLVASDRYGRTDTASALLEILPVTERIATLTADPRRVQTNRVVTFTVAVKPTMENVTYRFITGEDGGEIPSDLNSVRYSYRTPGEYRAYVVAYPRVGRPVFSRQIVIRVDPAEASVTDESGAGPVSRVEPPAKDKPQSGVEPPSKDEPQSVVEPPAKDKSRPEDELPWSSLIFGAIAISAVVYLLTRSKKTARKNHGVPQPVGIRPHKDPGTQIIDPDRPAYAGAELCVRAVFDKGKQEVDVEGDLASDERRTDE